eukprot:gene18954-903_t
METIEGASEVPVGHTVDSETLQTDLIYEFVINARAVMSIKWMARSCRLLDVGFCQTLTVRQEPRR